MVRELVQVAEDTHEIIQKYFMTSRLGNVTAATAKELYDMAVEVGEKHGTDAFDDAIELIVKDLCLSAEELSRLTSRKNNGTVVS